MQNGTLAVSQEMNSLLDSGAAAMEETISGTKSHSLFGRLLLIYIVKLQVLLILKQ